MRFESLVDAIGETPLVGLPRLAPEGTKLYAKLEGQNPTGSVKDRIARTMIESAERDGLLNEDRVLLEPSSGNTGISMAMVCRGKGVALEIVMPESVSMERRRMLEMYGAEVHLSPGDQGTNGAIRMATEMAQQYPKYLMLNQYENEANPRAHEDGTAAEIIRDLPEIDMFVAGLGTGGTLTGCGHALKRYNPAITVVAAEPPAGDLVQGLRSLEDGYIPPILDPSVIDRKFIVNSLDAFRATRESFRDRRRVRRDLVRCGVARCAARDQSRRREELRRAARRRRLEVPLDGRAHRRPGEGREGPRGSDLVVAENADRPIGVFDSGLGGLTVARAVIEVLPHESIVYFGDTARFPYGPKPLEEVQRNATEVMDFLCSKDVKMIVVACNSASSALFQLGRPKVGVPLVTVIDPPAQTAARLTRNKRIGVIGTDATIGSRQYEEALMRTRQPVEVFAKACPDFVELAERGETTGRKTLEVAEGYLSEMKDNGVDTLILGCTHYPLLQATIQYVMGPDVLLVSSAEETAKDVYTVLVANDLLRQEPSPPAYDFYASGDSDEFARLGPRFSAGHFRRPSPVVRLSRWTSRSSVAERRSPGRVAHARDSSSSTAVRTSGSTPATARSRAWKRCTTSARSTP